MFPIGRHIATTLNDLADKSRTDMCQIGTPLTSHAIERVAVSAGFELKYHRPLHFRRTEPLDDIDRHRISGSGIHMRRPRFLVAEPGEHTDSQKNKDHT